MGYFERSTKYGGFVSWLLVIALLKSADGYSTGAPTFVCETMVPGHGVGPQLVSSPYSVSATQFENEAGKIKVLVSSPTDDDFTGFLIQGRSNVNDTKTIGSFSKLPDEAKTIDCAGSKGSAATQRSNSRKNSVELEWEAPPGYDGPVTFLTTIVKNKNTFWVGTQSPQVQVKRFAGGSDIPNLPIESPFLTNILNAETDLYKGCGKSKNCFGIPQGCIQLKNCTSAVAVIPTGNKYQFDMIAKRSEYVAVGFSDDKSMGGDNVIECLHDAENSGVKAYRSWNLPNLKKNRREEEQLGFSLINGYYVDGYLYCRFTHDSANTMHDITFDLDKTPYYLLLASGTLLKPNHVGYHDVSYAYAQEKKLLSDLKAPQKEDPFYNGCNTLKNCFGYPNGCVSKRNCQAVAAILVEGTRYEFELKGETSAYVAVGLSNDTKMGGDSVMECVYDPNTPSNNVKVFMSWNVPNNKKNTREGVRQSAVNLITGTYEDGIVYCKFTRDVRSQTQGVTFDLANDKYYLLLVSGSSASSEGVGYHDKFTTASDQKRFLSDVGEFTGESKLLLRLHGAFMVSAWIGFASLGIVLARYYKQTWVGTSHCGNDVWFTWHRFIMLIVWILTIAGFVLIFVEIGDWVDGPGQTHAILGGVTSALSFLQPLIAWMRPHPNARRRPLFNWVHWLVGNVAHIVGIVTIFFAVQLNKAELPSWMDWILVGYVAFYVFMHLILSISGCMSERQGAKRVNAFPMKDMHATRSPLNNMERKRDSPYAGFRKLLLFIHILVIFCITSVLVVIVVFAPISSQWSSFQNSIKNM